MLPVGEHLTGKDQLKETEEMKGTSENIGPLALRACALMDGLESGYRYRYRTPRSQFNHRSLLTTNVASGQQPLVRLDPKVTAQTHS